MSRKTRQSRFVRRVRPVTHAGYTYEKQDEYSVVGIGFGRLRDWGEDDGSEVFQHADTMNSNIRMAYRGGQS